MYKGGNHIAFTEQDKKLLEAEGITAEIVYKGSIEKTSGITDSKFGGVPYWDMQKEYPKSDKGEMLMMLAQINLDELNRDGYNPDGKLPKTGMLQFFIDIYDNDGTYGLQDWEAKEDDTGKLLQNGHRVIYHKSIDYNVSPQEVESLGIPGVGVANAKLICRHFDSSFEAVMAADENELMQIDGIGAVIAGDIVRYFSDAKKRENAKVWNRVSFGNVTYNNKKKED